MKRLVQLVAVVAVLVYVGAAVGQTAPKSKDTVKGALVSITIDPVDSTKATLVVGKEKKVEITADSSTKITLDGKAAKLDNLKVGDLLTVTLASGLAKKIEAKTGKTPAAGNVESGKKAETPAANEPFKGALVSMILVALLGLIGVLLIDRHTEVSPVIPIALLIIGSNGIIAILLPYAAESYPLNIRGRATGWVAACSKLGGLLAQTLSIFALVPPLGIIAILIMVPIVFALALILWFGNETRGLDLRDLEQGGPLIAE